MWALWGTALRATVDALASIGSDDPAVIGASIARATELVQTVRAAGLTVYVTLFEGALGQALAAAAASRAGPRPLGRGDRVGP
ncbi:adenylate cyclase [Mycobacterium pseudoshottsii JCM 15466]|uniref:Uncharacterized protein n=1 Tax=Mycobacterium pseudoshottsii TaxID=265949 RepID=A0A9N7LT83_9MYCO|nr:hypothetical protein [Mycobacterium pseudoshottsii]EPQ47349.1 Adenylate cyclase [Mycobacterium sp. 012931]BBA88621.1 hypothetical protein MPSD_31570 [Mycobacterium pseudoshottsii JCM 15466]MBC9863668.1 Adenylate cyclase / Guanylate cyclase [Mycobacterium pseudoshottsii]BDN82877.1 hypothetical protein NJB1907Z4_C30920 [Mycobacterium pseudoshottsii]GAQ33189.1 adenylate cyclase [Mycobacterium pseudoshottsii JCM 15466]